jgi:signal peptide peptidase SppA
MKYARILAAVAATPWAIEPNKGRAIASFLTRKANGETIPEAEIQAAVASRKDGKPRQAKSVAVIGVYGTIVQREGDITEYSGGTSADSVGAAVQQAAADPRVDVILLDVDSPGGDVFGVQECGQKIFAARAQKKIVGIANSMAASAGYWLLAQCTEVVVTPGGLVGSIGVYQMHVDYSKQLEQEGVAVSLISAGDLKTAGNCYQPLTEEARASFQKMVDGYYDAFVKAVAQGRGVSPGAVRSGFGRGDVVSAKEAVAEGMADRVATFDDTLARFGIGGSGSQAAAAAAATPRLDTEVRRRRLLT